MGTNERTLIQLISLAAGLAVIIGDLALRRRDFITAIAVFTLIQCIHRLVLSRALILTITLTLESVRPLILQRRHITIATLVCPACNNRRQTGNEE